MRSRMDLTSALNHLARSRAPVGACSQVDNYDGHLALTRARLYLRLPAQYGRVTNSLAAIEQGRQACSSISK